MKALIEIKNIKDTRLFGWFVRMFLKMLKSEQAVRGGALLYFYFGTRVVSCCFDTEEDAVILVDSQWMIGIGNMMFNVLQRLKLRTAYSQPAPRSKRFSMRQELAGFAWKPPNGLVTISAQAKLRNEIRAMTHGFRYYKIWHGLIRCHKQVHMSTFPAANQRIYRVLSFCTGHLCPCRRLAHLSCKNACADTTAPF